MNKKLLVIVPYRDRESHLENFISYITNILHLQDVKHKIVVVEQSPERLFNRGLLCNIGFCLYQECNYICIHDVDIIGENFDYSYEPIVTHLSVRYKKRNYKEFYPRCLGGVVLFPTQDFIKVNGFSNEYWGWGAEDDDLRLRCDVMGVKVQRKQGSFQSLPHPTIDHKDRPKQSPGYIKNLKRLNRFIKSGKKQLEILENDGLNNIDFFYRIKEIVKYSQYDMVKTTIK
jgi:hypothetical protein